MKQLLFAAFLLVQGQVGTTVETGSVTGQLLSKKGTPAASVRMAAMPVTEDRSAASVLIGISQTDENGRYKLADIPPGRYYIFAGLIDSPNYYPGTASLSDARVITVEPGMTIAHVDFSLARPVTMRVSGRIRGSANLRDVSGKYLTLTPRGLSRSALPITTTVAADGAFSFFPVSPGEYQITSPVRGLSYVQVTVTDDDIEDLQLPAVDCNTGVEVRGRLAGLPIARVERVSLTGVRFRCTPDIAVAPDGSFIFKGVPGDTYAVRLTPSPLGWPGATIVVESRDLADVEVRLPVTLEVRGHIVVDDGSAVPRLAHGGPLSVQARGPGNQLTAQHVEDDGSFSLRLVKGSYRISMPALPKNYSIKSITSSEFADLTSQLLEVNESGETQIRIMLAAEKRDADGVQVSGRIIPAAAGALAKPEGVLLVSSSGGRNAAFLSTAVEGDGSFEFRGVAPGRYDLQTFPDSPVALREIDVNQTNVTGLELALPVLFKVNGAVEWVDAHEGLSTVPQSFSVQFSRRAQTRDEGNGLYVWAALAQAGSFQVYLPEGDYHFSITGVPKDAHITSATFGSLELLETDLPIRSSLDPMTVRVTVRQ